MSVQSSAQPKLSIPALVVQLILVIVILPGLPLLVAWRWDWWEAWVYLAVAALGFLVSRALAMRRHPDLLVERARSLEHADTKPWDRVLAPLVALGSALIPLTAGVQMRVGASADFGLPAKLAAMAVLLAGYALATYALVENRFFSGTVRIQTERGHHVVSGGPYAWVRHPGYAGSLLAYLATPIWLDSPWAFVAAVLLAAALIIRTALEDRTLQDELPGYRDYAARVRYRLVPGVW
jgi:protein-S-isoprenylcysteine O-methyltransferase Ste14